MFLYKSLYDGGKNDNFNVDILLSEKRYPAISGHGTGYCFHHGRGNGLAQTAKADTLNIYSSRSPQLIQPLLDAYTTKTGMNFKVLHLSDGMAQRLKAEGENTPADIVLTVDISRLSEIDDLGVLAAVDSPLLRANIRPNGVIRIITGLDYRPGRGSLSFLPNGWMPTH